MCMERKMGFSDNLCGVCDEGKKTKKNAKIEDGEERKSRERKTIGVK